ncbi:MAG: BatA domain-containing protein [Gemmatimonadales bacterium]
MGFLQPLALLGLAAAAIPALLHLLQRRVPPTVTFPAVRYLSETERRHSRRLKLRNLLLLLLRTALIALIVLAAARPVARLPVGGTHGPSALALVVDNSLSSGAVVVGRRVVDILAGQARNAVRRLTSSDRLWLVLADGIPRQRSRAQALLILDSLDPEPVRLDIGRAVRSVARVVADDPLPGEVLVVSDLQRTALSPGDAPAALTLLVEPSLPPRNRGVDSVRLTPAVWSPGGTAVVSVGGSSRTAGEVRLEIGGRVVARDLARPGERLALGVEQLPAGWHVARVQVGPDELRADDTWHLALRSAPAVQAVADPSVGSFLLEALDVLQSAGRVARGGDVTLAAHLGPGRTILVPPVEGALVGGINRALAARGVSLRFGEEVRGEWRAESELLEVGDARVYRRYRLRGAGAVIASTGGEPWIVREGEVVIVGSRLEESWTSLPVSAGFLPFLDGIINRSIGSGALRVGATPSATVTLPPGAVWLLTPAGRMPVPGDRRIRAPAVPGVYFMVGAGGDTVGALEVNHDPAESLLAPASREALEATFGPDVTLLGEEALERELFRAARRADLSAFLLALAVVLALVELAVATFGGRVREDG